MYNFRYKKNWCLCVAKFIEYHRTNTAFIGTFRFMFLCLGRMICVALQLQLTLDGMIKYSFKKYLQNYSHCENE